MEISLKNDGIQAVQMCQIYLNSINRIAWHYFALYSYQIDILFINNFSPNLLYACYKIVSIVIIIIIIGTIPLKCSNLKNKAIFSLIWDLIIMVWDLH